ncbi:MAG TPA: NAD-dependent deacetylase [Campylobacterales bacterium]|nr:NAD-dependent deacetylase [Campylobacterales bacterium]HIP41688.1 NAD-dependent deacetylase [Campylobacterales bacterium]
MHGKSKRVYILSGAGLSAESGIKTFRDSNGLWENYRVEEVCSVQGFIDDRQKVLDFYDARRADLETKEPNHAHKQLAKLKDTYPKSVVMLTQNVDDMLEQAGCKGVIHLHGTLTDLRCEACRTVFKIGYRSQEGVTCPKCHSDAIRHNVVMFGESAPAYAYLSTLYDEADMVVVIGTSGNVIDTAYIAQLVDHSILNNLDVDQHHDQYFKKVIYAPATQAIDEICELIEEFLG